MCATICLFKQNGVCLIYNLITMTAIADLLAPTKARIPVAINPRDTAYMHFTDPKRRALVRSIGFEGVTEGYLRQAYGPSWGAVQADIRALLNAGLICIEGDGKRQLYSLDITAYSPELLNGLLGNQQPRRIAIAA